MDRGACRWLLLVLLALLEAAHVSGVVLEEREIEGVMGVMGV